MIKLTLDDVRKFSILMHLVLFIVLMGCGQKTKTISKDYKVRTEDGVELAVTLTRPEAQGKTPLIILVHGSGNDSRQNEYYKLLTKEFCEIGFSVLAYDKRGCDSSTGNWLTVPFSYLKDDVNTIVNTFIHDTSITKVGLWGGSEGSNVSIWAASENQEIDFVIAQSFTAMTFAEQNKYVKQTRIKNYPNTSEQKIKELMDLQDLLYDYIRTGNNYNKYITAFDNLRNEPWFSDILNQPVTENSPWSQWYKTKLDINSTTFVKQLNIPVLFIWGEDDQLIDVKKSMALTKAANIGTNLTYKIFENADHSIYSGGRNPDHLKFMKDWLLKTVINK